MRRESEKRKREEKARRESEKRKREEKARREREDERKREKKAKRESEKTGATHTHPIDSNQMQSSPQFSFIRETEKARK